MSKTYPRKMDIELSSLFAIFENIISQLKDITKKLEEMRYV